MLPVSTIESASPVLPLTVPEQLICPFCWYLEGKVRLGMRLDNELYNLVSEFNSTERMRAFELSRQLTDKCGRVVISVASAGSIQYRVWVSLREWSDQLQWVCGSSV